MSTTSELTAEQAAALNKFASEHGRTWRAKLRRLWTTGREASRPDGAFLRQIRNSTSPTFLDTYKPQ